MSAFPESGHSGTAKSAEIRGRFRPKAAIEKPRHKGGADHSASNYEVPRETRYAGLDHLPAISQADIQHAKVLRSKLRAAAREGVAVLTITWVD